MNADDPDVAERVEAEVTLIGRNVRRLCETQGLSLRKLTRRADVNSQTIWDVLAGRANPTVKTLVLLARALGVETRELFAPIPEADGETAP